MTVAGYIRCSGGGQIEGDSFPRQDEAIAKFCVAQGWSYDRAYVEYGVTGDNDLEGRPALSALLYDLENPDDAGQRCPKIIAIEHPDRMARGIRAGVLILEDMHKAKTRVVCVCDGRDWTIDKTDPEAMLIWGIRQLFAQYDKMRLVAKLAAGRERKRKSGLRSVGERPYGSPASKRSADDPKAIAQAQREAEILRQIMSLASQGLTPMAIARNLNAENVPTRKGGPWTRHIVNRIIRRELSNV